MAVLCLRLYPDIRFLTFSPLTEVVNPKTTESCIKYLSKSCKKQFKSSIFKRNQSFNLPKSALVVLMVKSSIPIICSSLLILIFKLTHLLGHVAFTFLRINSGNDVISRKIIKN